MLLFSRIVHVLAMGLWFGTVVFFTVAGLLLFQAFEAESLKGGPDTAARPLWFPAPDIYKKAPPSDKFPKPLRLEQGSRAAGVAVGPIFPWYYGIQAVCGGLAVITALGWCISRRGPRLNAVRAALLALALAGVGAGWWMEGVVAQLRGPRDDLTDAALKPDNPTPEQIHNAETARAAFLQWHSYSLLDNFTVFLLVTAGMALTASMPTRAPTLLAGEAEKKFI